MPAFTPIVPPVRGLRAPVRLGVGVSRVGARSRRWRPVARGWHVRADAPDVVEQRVLEQSTRLKGTGAATGWAALRVLGGGYFDGLERDGRTPRRVPLVAGASRLRDDAEVWVVRERLAEEEVVVRQGVRCVSPERAVTFEVCRSADLRESVVVIDMACAAELTSLRRLEAWLTERPDSATASVLCGRSSSPTSTATRRARRGCGWCGCSMPGGRDRCATARSSTRPGGCWASPTSSTPRPASSVSTTVPTTAVATGTGATCAARTCSVAALVDRIAAAYGRAEAETDRAPWRMGDPVHPVTGRPCLSLDDRLDARDRERSRKEERRGE